MVWESVARLLETKMIRLGIERYGGAYFSHIRAERMSIRDLTSNFSTRGASLIYGWGGRGAPYIDEGSVHILGTLELVSLDGELLAGLGNGSLDTGLDELQGLGMRGRGRACLLGVENIGGVDDSQHVGEGGEVGSGHERRGLRHTWS